MAFVRGHTCVVFLEYLYTAAPSPPAHSDWRPTHVSRVVLVDCNVVVVVRLVLFISTSHQGSSSIDHCVRSLSAEGAHYLS